MTTRFTKFKIRQVEIFESSFHTTETHIIVQNQQKCYWCAQNEK